MSRGVAKLFNPAEIVKKRKYNLRIDEQFWERQLHNMTSNH